MNNFKTVVWLIVPGLAGILSSQATATEARAAASPADVAAVVTSNDQFAANLFAHLQEDADGNFIFSPYSISVALAMTSGGARGDTEKQMAEVLHFSLPAARLHSALAALQQRLTSADMPEKNRPGRPRADRPTADSYQLRIANRLWGQQGYHFLPQFLQRTRAGYGAELGPVNFSRPDAARQTINRWTEDQTEGKIKNLIPSGALSPDTRLVLTNAIYFKGNWTHKFETKRTADAPFHVSADRQVQVPMMQQTRSFGYKEADGLQILHLPYGRAGSLAMLILLPEQAEGLAELQEQLTSDNLRAWSKGLTTQTVRVYLPRFKITAQFQLKDVLESMGMTFAFDADQADFSGISTQEQLYISAVIHKAFVDVNEEGTEAAAATAVIPVPTARAGGPVEEPPVFRADHPFVFAIRDNRTESILFLGRVLNPEAAN